jgi:asparaginyl-tRNA synthetase
MIADRTVQVLKVRALLLQKARRWFENNGYTEVQAPILTPAQSKSPNAFRLKYYSKNAYLTKGFLPYGKALAEKLGKVYTIAPSLRKEQSTGRHLNEYWRIEAIQESGLSEIIDVQEDLVAFICGCLGELKETLGCFNRSVDDLEKIRKPFSRFTYDEVIKILQEDGHKIWWGQEIDWQLERHLSLKLDAPIFITKNPFSLDTFLSARDSARPELSLSADLLAPEGYGEIASSTQMISGQKELVERLTQAEISPKDQSWFSNFFKSTFEPCSAFALGVERLLQWLCKLPDIKEATAFPRTMDTIYP